MTSSDSEDRNPNLNGLVVFRDVCCTIAEAGGDEEAEASAGNTNIPPPPPRRYFLQVGWKRSISGSSSATTTNTHSEVVLLPRESDRVVPLRCRPYAKLHRATPIEPGWLEAVSRLTEAPPTCLGGKKLTNTDVTGQQNRFKFTKEMETLLVKMLEEEEMRAVHGLNGLQVRTFDRRGRLYVLDLKFWGSSRWYVLKGKDYMSFVEKNGLRCNVLLTAWVFRSERRLCFALVS